MVSTRAVRRRLAPAALGLTVAGALWFAGAADLLWRAIGGPPDLGPVAFESLVRRTVPNDALACPADLCPAPRDIEPPHWPIPASALQQAFASAILAEPRAVRVAVDDGAMTERWVQRTPLMRFPDTVVVRFLDRPGGGSTVALYSRSQLGRGDGGVNRERVTRWLRRLEATVPVVSDRPAAGTRPSATPPAAAPGSR